MFRLLRRTKVDSEKNIHSKVNAKQHHSKRIGNLNEEIEVIRTNLKILHLESDEPISAVKKQVDVLITRLTHLQYEVEIREDCLKWLT